MVLTDDYCFSDCETSKDECSRNYHPQGIVSTATMETYDLGVFPGNISMYPSGRLNYEHSKSIVYKIVMMYIKQKETLPHCRV